MRAFLKRNGGNVGEREEQKRNHVELSTDFLSCDRDCADVECASAVKFWERLPSAIRTNYAKLGVPHPFGGCAAWESLVSKEARESLHVQRIVIHQVGVGALKEVILILCGRGHPTANASICAARVGDLQKGRGHRDKEAAAEEHLEGIASHPVQGEISDPVIIGRVTAGGYSWRRGKGIARALVCAQAYRVALLNQKGDGGRRGHLLVRVRNINCQGDEGFLAFARAAVPDR